MKEGEGNRTTEVYVPPRLKGLGVAVRDAAELIGVEQNPDGSRVVAVRVTGTAFRLANGVCL